MKKLLGTRSTKIRYPSLTNHMCGRFALKTKPPKIAKLFNASLLEDFNPHYNIAPTARIPVIRTLTPEEQKNGLLGHSTGATAQDKKRSTTAIGDPDKKEHILRYTRLEHVVYLFFGLSNYIDRTRN